MIPFQNGTFDRDDEEREAQRSFERGSALPQTATYLAAEMLSVFLDESGQVGLFLYTGEKSIPVGYLQSERETVRLIEDLRMLLSLSRQERFLPLMRKQDNDDKEETAS